MELKHYIVIGGIIWLVTKWLNSIDRYMKKNNIKVGDKVISEKQDEWGNMVIKQGTIITFNNVPHVKFNNYINNKNMEPKDKTYKKK